MLCGKPTRHGTCRIELRGGKCMTHDSNLAARNSKVAQAFRAARPDVFKAQRTVAGKCGWQKTCEIYGHDVAWKAATEKSRQWRLDHPSKPEQRAIELLTQMSIAFDREVLVGKYSLDFIVGPFACIEINGHQFKPSSECPKRRLI